MKVVKISKDNAAETASRLRSSGSTDGKIRQVVKEIVEMVRKEGDQALIRLASQLDHVALDRDGLVTTRDEMRLAVQDVSPGLVAGLKTLRQRILGVERRLHRRLSLSLSMGDCRIDVRPVALESVGCYAPGGLASYPSTVMMLGLPGHVAGVERLVLATPPRSSDDDKRLIMAAAYLAGFHEILWVGGAQAIAALAYGTEKVRPVQKIVGPGNRYVLEAKRFVSSDVGIDFTAGPTELLVVTDSNSPHSQAVLELAAQAEHSPDTLVGALALDGESEAKLLATISGLLKELPENSAAKNSLGDNGFICTADSWKAARKFINTLAPEHLLIYARISGRRLREIRNAGVVSYGPASSSVFLDYFAGPSHVLPTEGMASIRGGLSVLDFVKLLPTVRPTRRGLKRALKSMQQLILAERLPLHLRALKEAAGLDTS